MVFKNKLTTNKERRNVGLLQNELRKFLHLNEVRYGIFSNKRQQKFHIPIILFLHSLLENQWVSPFVCLHVQRGTVRISAQKVTQPTTSRVKYTAVLAHES